MAARRKAKAKVKGKAKANAAGKRRSARPAALAPRYCPEDGSELDGQGRCQNPTCPRYGQVQPGPGGGGAIS